MHTKTVFQQLLNIEKTVVENVWFETVKEEEIFVMRVRAMSRETQRCPHCGRKGSVYDGAARLRRWRSLDFGAWRVYLEACAPRINCRAHGIVVARVPWARHDSDFTKDFESQVTWMALHATITDVSELYRIKWDTVASICRRVHKTLEDAPGRFDGLEAIGIDETSYKKGHKYMTVVVDHKTGRLIWAHKGYGKEVLEQFFALLTEAQRQQIKYVTADGARWIADCVKAACPNAERCIDPFHVVTWATEALDGVRKESVRNAVAESGKKKRIKSSINTRS